MMRLHHHNMRCAARRGMALMLVMIALVIGSVMTAGYLMTQNTSIGLTQNQAASDMARQLAATGIDCALYYLKNNDGWDESNYNNNWRLICDQSSNNRILIDHDIFAGAHVRVALNPVYPATTFSTDARTAVDIVSTGTFNGQNVTITSRAKPTGSGTPWQQGIFAFSTININGSTATIDSYRSGDSGPSVYVPTPSPSPAWLNHAEAKVVSMDSIVVDGVTVYWGSSLALKNSSNITTRNGGYCVPKPATSLPMKRIPGWVTPPAINTTSLSTINKYTTEYTVKDGTYPSKFELVATDDVPEGDPENDYGRVLTLRGSGVISVNGDFKLEAGTTLRVRKTTSSASSNVIFYVAGGNVRIQGRIVIDAGCTLKIFATNEVLLERYARANTDSMNTNGTKLYNKAAVVGPSAFQIYGLSTCSKIRMTDHAWMSGMIFAPKSLVELTCDSSNSTNEAVTFFGGVVCDGLNIRGASKLHQDLDSLTAIGTNIVDGTYAGEYEVRQSW